MLSRKQRFNFGINTSSLKTSMLPGSGTLVYLSLWLLGTAHAKWVEGHVDTKEKWAFLSRFCFLSLDGQFEYLIEFDKDMGTPNLLLYYDDDSQWPSVYHSSKSCKERENVLNKAGQNQIIKLSHWYPDTESSGCVITRENKELPASKSSTTPKPTTSKPQKNTNKTENNTTTVSLPHDPSYYDQFLKTTPPTVPKTTVSDTNNTTTWFEVPPTDENVTATTFMNEDGLWESVGVENNGSHLENLKLEDVELMFSNNEVNTGHKIKRSTFELYERYRRRRLNSEASTSGGGDTETGKRVEKLIVSCHNSRRFRSARERWWFVAISNCDSPKGLDVRYKFLMTNGPDGDFWHEHFSADEFYVLPVLLAYTFAYVIVMVAVVMCSVELRARHLLHTTYKLFLISIVVQHLGVTTRALAAVRYAVNGFGGDGARVTGEFLSGLSEMTFLLLLILMAKGYTITRGRLKLAFTVKLTVFMCCYCVTYVALFIYQAKAFDPGEVLYLYESPAGYGLVALRICGWCVFAYATFFTVRKFPEKNMFYAPFSICGTLWFFAGPLFILTANSYIDKWVRESVVTAVLLFISFSGHIMFLLLTLPVFANKNFPYHVRTTQIGVMEVTGNGAIDNFGHNPYHPATGAAQTVIIPLTRRTEELIGNMYSQYMATAPPAPLDDRPHFTNGSVKRADSLSPSNRLIQQSSTETNTSEDIKPAISKTDSEPKEKQVFTIEGQMAKLDGELSPKLSPDNSLTLPNGESNGDSVVTIDGFKDPTRSLPLLKSRRNVLEPIRRDEVPSWSLAKGPSVVAVMRKSEDGAEDLPPATNGTVPSLSNGKTLPAVKHGLASSGEISTIREGQVQSYNNTVSKATVDLFSVGGRFRTQADNKVNDK